MWHGVSVVTKPEGLPIAVSDVKSRIDVVRSDQDAMIEAFIRGAVARIDGPDGIGYAMMRQTWRKTMRCFPRRILLPGAPIVAVSAIEYVDTDGAPQTLDAAHYRVDVTSEPATVEVAYGLAWPATRDVSGAVSVTYTLGVEDPDDVPPDLVDAVCLLVGHRYVFREAISSVEAQALPMGFDAIVSDYRRGMVTA